MEEEEQVVETVCLGGTERHEIRGTKNDHNGRLVNVSGLFRITVEIGQGFTHFRKFASCACRLGKRRRKKREKHDAFH